MCRWTIETTLSGLKTSTREASCNCQHWMSVRCRPKKAAQCQRRSVLSNTRQTGMWLSLGLAFVGGYGDAASFVLVKTLTGHVTGNLVLAGCSRSRLAGDAWASFRHCRFFYWNFL